MSQQKLLLEQFVSGAATQLNNIKRSSYTNDVLTENIWTFGLVVQNGFDVPIFMIVWYMQRGHFNQQNQNSDTFYRPTVVIAQCSIGSEKYRGAEKSPFL